MKNLILGFSATILLAGIFAPAASAQTAVDLDSWANEGIKILEIGNSTKTPGSISWQNYSISADAGDVIALLIHYHNFTSGEVAQNVKISASISTANSTSHSLSINLWADNSVRTYADYVTANISSAQTVTFIPGSVLWNPKGQGATPLPLGQTGNEIIGPLGLNLGNVNYGDAESGYVILKIQVSGTPAPQPTGNPPVVVTGDPGNIIDTSAVLKGYVNPNGSNTNAWFEWGRAVDGLTNITAQQNLGGGTPYLTYLSGISNLSAGTVYIYRAVAQNAAGTSYGSTLSFTAVGGGGTTGGGITGGGGSCLPIVTTNSASFITKDSTTLRGLVNPQGRSTSGWFEYGKSYALTNRTESQTAGSGSVDTDILKYLANLDSNTSYYFRAVAQNNCGIAQGSILSFTTGLGSGNPPEVTTLAATNITQTSATINGSVNPNNYDASAWFEWGTNSTLSAYAVTPTANLGSGNLFKAISSMPYGLVNDTVYYYRAVAQNAFGSARGTILSFRTGTVTAPVPSAGLSFSVWKETKNLSFPNGTIYVNSSSIGDTLEFSLNIKNKSSSELKNIVVKDKISSYFDFVESNPGTSSDSSGSLPAQTGSLAWNINSIAPGETKTIALKIKTKTVEESVVISNSFTATAGGVTRTSNSTTNILNPSLMALDISVDKDNVKKNETYDYTVRYRNIGIADIDNALLKVILPQNVTLKDSQPDYASSDSNIFFYKIGRVNKNEKGTINISVKVNDAVESGEKLIATAVLDYTDAFGAPQPNISASVTSVAESGFFGAAAALGLSLGGSNFGFYLLTALLLAVIGAVVYIRLKVSKMLKV